MVRRLSTLAAVISLTIFAMTVVAFPVSYTAPFAPFDPIGGTVLHVEDGVMSVGKITLTALPLGRSITVEGQTVSTVNVIMYKPSCSVPLWLVAAATAILPLFRAAAVYRRMQQRRRTLAGLCPHCGYNLTANTSGVCPECGTVVAKKTTATA